MSKQTQYVSLLSTKDRNILTELKDQNNIFEKWYAEEKEVSCSSNSSGILQTFADSKDVSTKA